MSNQNDLKTRILRELAELFSDTSVSQEQTLEDFEEIEELTGTFISALEADISAR